MPPKIMPGTVVEFSEGDKGFSGFKKMIALTGGLSLGQVCAVTGLEPSTVQNWVKRGFVARPVKKKYYERQFARILLISSLRNAMKIEKIGCLMAGVNGDTEDEADDIISEAALYDYLCEIVEAMGGRVAAHDEISSIVAKVTEGFKEPRKGALLRLRKALSVMTCAWISAYYIEETDFFYSEFQKNIMEE